VREVRAGEWDVEQASADADRVEDDERNGERESDVSICSWPATVVAVAIAIVCRPALP
jgi:hypothetical protein